MNAERAITVTLGDLQRSVDARVQSGEYESESEVLQEAVRALDRHDAALTAYYREKIQEALDEPQPDIPMEEVFAELEAYHAEQVKAGR